MILFSAKISAENKKSIGVCIAQLTYSRIQFTLALALGGMYTATAVDSHVKGIIFY